jgi:hypothetical protein
LININGTGAQYLNGAATANAGALPQVNINKTGTLYLSGFPTVANNFTYTAGTISAGSSTFCFTRNNVNAYAISGNLSLANVLFSAPGNNLTVNFQAAALLTVTGSLSTDGAGRINLNASAAGVTAIQAQGDISIGNSFAGGNGNADILINGTGNQLFSSVVTAGSGRLPYISIQKSSGTLSLSGIISVARDWTYLSGVVDAASNSSTVAFGGNALNVSSNGMSFYNVTITANNITPLNDLTVMGDLTISGGTLSGGAHTINLAGNWSNSGGTFSWGTSTVNLNGAALQAISNAGGGSFYNLTVDNTGTGIRLMNNVTVRTTLTLNQGNIALNGNTLALGTSTGNRGTLVRSSGTLTGTGSFTRWFNNTTIADGSVTGLFPMGSATDYRPFYVSAPLNRPTTGGSISVAYTDASTNSVVSIADGTFTVSIRKDLHWTVSTGNGLAGGTYNLDAQGTGFGQIGSVGDLRLTLSNAVVGTAGANAGTSADPQVNRTGLSLANLANAFYIGSIDPISTTLPVTLISFTATMINSKVRLDWETAAEVNNDYFMVQRSDNARDWKDLARVEGSGNTNADAYYTAYDEAPLSGTSYYRLKQTDRDGQTSFSFIRTVNNSAVAAMQIYPNPASDYAYIRVPGEGEINVVLFNAGGQVMHVPFSFDGDKVALLLTRCPAGLYFIRITRGKSNTTGRIEIRK